MKQSRILPTSLNVVFHFTDSNVLKCGTVNDGRKRSLHHAFTSTSKHSTRRFSIDLWNSL